MAPALEFCMECDSANVVIREEWRVRDGRENTQWFQFFCRDCGTKWEDWEDVEV